MPPVQCDTARLSSGTAAVQWQYSGSTVVVHWQYSGITVAVHRQCSGSAVRHSRDSMKCATTRNEVRDHVQRRVKMWGITVPSKLSRYNEMHYHHDTPAKVRGWGMG